MTFEDDRVCKSYLLGCCPHELLSSTRMDVGECSKIHDVALKADYEIASNTKDYYYDVDAMEHLESFLGDCDIRVEQAKRRLKDTQEELSDEQAAKANKIHDIGELIGTKLAKAEQLGEQGDVDESLKLLNEVDDLKKQKISAELEYRNTMPSSSYQQQKLRVCEVCSAFLGIYDNDRRLADHFGGKLHVGFITLRQRLDELKQAGEDRRKQRIKEREEKRELERKQRSASRRSRSRSRDRGRRSRDGRRSRERRSRSRDRHSKSHKRSRSRDGQRSHKKHKHTKSSRSRRSRSGDRSRSPRQGNGYN